MCLKVESLIVALGCAALQPWANLRTPLKKNLKSSRTRANVFG